jgi:hypothetical protein
MSRSTTAALLSTLVLPGTGHLYLKHFPRGIALIAISLACLWIIVKNAMQQASLVLDKIGSEGIVPDASQLSDLVSQSSSGTGSSIATLVLVGCWLIGIVDAYRLGKRQG